jgi:hypothetical protein
MSLFDYVKPSKAIYTACCNDLITEFQTKDLCRDMSVYRENTKVLVMPQLRLATKVEQKKLKVNHDILIPNGKNIRTKHFRNRVIYCYAYCHKCDKMTAQYFKFDRSGLLKRYKTVFLEREFMAK